MKKKYRIVMDMYNGYAIEVWRWWFPFWVEVHGSNSLSSIEELEGWKNAGFPPIRNWIFRDKFTDLKNGVVKYL